MSPIMPSWPASRLGSLATFAPQERRPRMTAAALAFEAYAEPVPFSDLSLQWTEIADVARDDMDALFATSSFCLGPFVERFETAIAEYLGVRYAIGVNSGTSAHHLALIAAGVRAGDKVI